MEAMQPVCSGSSHILLQATLLCWGMSLMLPESDVRNSLSMSI